VIEGKSLSVTEQVDIDCLDVLLVQELADCVHLVWCEIEAMADDGHTSRIGEGGMFIRRLGMV
jgi:hypothetical protein